MLSRLATIFLFSILTIFISCKGKSDKNPEISDTTVKANPDTTKIPLDTGAAMTGPRLYCNSLAPDPDGNPHSEIMLLVDGKRTKLKASNSCEEIDRSIWKNYDIPDSAINAIGGFWAGLGQYWYLVKKDGKYAVFEGFQDEGVKTKGWNWKEISIPQ
jgi:hypothetical protein